MKTMLKKFPQIKISWEKSTRKNNFWNFLGDIPEINVIAGPLSKLWKQRVQEEIRLFESWRKIDPTFPFRELRLSNNNDRKFLVSLNSQELFGVEWEEWLNVSILIPINYPFSRPSIGDPRTDITFFNRLKKWTNNHPFCMPPIIRTWWRKYRGKAGITHFLYAFSIFITIAGRSSYKKPKFILDI